MGTYTAPDLLYKPSVGETGWGGAVDSNFDIIQAKLLAIGALVTGSGLVYNVKDATYGALGDGSTNDSTAVQGAVNAAYAAGGGIVYFPPGAYKIKEIVLKTGVSLIGAGAGSTSLVGGIASGYILQHFASDGTLDDVVLQGLTLDGGNVASVSLMTLEYTSRITVRDCIFANVASIWQVRIGVTTASDSVARNSDIVFEGCRFDTKTGTNELLLLLNAKNVTVRNCVFTGCAAGTPGVGIYQVCDGITFRDCLFDGGGFIYYSLSTNNILIEGTRFVGASGDGIHGANEGDNGDFGFTRVRNLSIVDCYFSLSSSGNSPIELGAVDGARVIDCTFYRNDQMGILLTNGRTPVSAAPKDVLISGCKFLENNFGAHGAVGSAGILVTCSAMSGLKVTNCDFRDDQGTPHQEIPLTIDKGSAVTHTDCMFIGNNMKSYAGAVTYYLQNSALFDATCVFANNANFLGGNNPDSSRWYGNAGLQPQGIASITVGASPYTYTNADQVPEAIYIFGGTVSQIAKNGTNLFISTDKTIWLAPGEAVVVTYTVAPTMKRDRK